jgi:hypothetical protein
MAIIRAPTRTLHDRLILEENGDAPGTVSVTIVSKNTARGRRGLGPERSAAGGHRRSTAPTSTACPCRQCCSRSAVDRPLAVPESRLADVSHL